LQFWLPPGPAVASGTDFSKAPPVSPSALTDPPNGDEHAGAMTVVAPAAPSNFKRVRRSTRP
jgi:hypothetical protein